MFAIAPVWYVGCCSFLEKYILVYDNWVETLVYSTFKHQDWGHLKSRRIEWNMLMRVTLLSLKGVEKASGWAEDSYQFRYLAVYEYEMNYADEEMMGFSYWPSFPPGAHVDWFLWCFFCWKWSLLCATSLALNVVFCARSHTLPVHHILRTKA